MTRLRAWVQASRPLAQIFIAAPLLYGQALAYAQHGTFRFDLLLLVLLFGIFDQVFVVFATAAADYRHEDDTHSRPSRRPPHRDVGPPLPPIALAQGALSALLAAGGVSVVLALGERRAWMLVMTAMSAHLLWIYAFPPFRLATRGFGEWVGGLRLGLMLPAIGYYAQANTFVGFKPAFLVPSFLLGYAVLVTLGIPDAATDALAGKRTFAVRRGERSARRASLSLIAIAAVSTPLAVPQAGIATLLLVAPPVLFVLLRNFRLLSRPESDLVPMREAFVWRNGVAVALTLTLWAVSAIILRGS